MAIEINILENGASIDAALAGSANGIPNNGNKKKENTMHHIRNVTFTN